MKAISKLKDEARRHEQRGEWEKAIQVYLQVLAAADEAEGGEIELPLYNRVGDLCVRLGRQQDAVKHYELAADRYAEAGLYNNAIALCNKALRYQPGRLEVIRKLGQYSASQGFFTDARRYFLEYADKKFAAGEGHDALSALTDYANVAGDAEIRELLGRKLHSHSRTAEGIAELKRAYALRLGSGEADAALALRREILSIEPTAFDDEVAGGTVPEAPQHVMLPAPAARLPDLDDIREEDEGPFEAPDTAFRDDSAEAAGLDELEPEGGSETGLLADFESTSFGAGDFDATALDELAGIERADEFDAGLFDTQRQDIGLDAPLGDELEGDLDIELEGDLDVELEGDLDVELEGDLDVELPMLDPNEGLTDFDIPLLAGEEDAEPLPLIGQLPILEGTEAALDAEELDALRPPDLESLEPVVEDPTPLPFLGEADTVETPPKPPPAEQYVDLGGLVAEAETADGDTRFTVEEQSPTGDEDDDFAELLSQFKRKVAQNVAPEDAAAHYDLGLAFKDMGLLDEAISELQVALHAGDMRLKVYEELGLCFLMKQEYSIAEKVLRRALEMKYQDELELLGVYYHLGRAYEGLGNPDSARDAYERVLALDINFGDVSERIERL